MKHLYLYFTPLVLIGVTLGGCNRYAFSINDNELYRPPPLYNGFRVADQALETCIHQTINDKRITQVEQLSALRCSNAGIRSLAGLEHFAWLQKLDLSDNDIHDSSALTKLTRLQFLKILGNPALNCTHLATLKKMNNPEIIAPAHCNTLTQ